MLTEFVLKKTKLRRIPNPEKQKGLTCIRQPLRIFSLLASRFSLLASRFSLLASRFSLLASRFSLLASRFSLLASR
ncbi:hypothetical protein, partial [Vibrio sp. CUB2]|uniref:hypothetical protein n=1 Tax=Vibrio sp. CUB2 TaxID=2315233 RepID=UPI001AD94169